MPLSIRYLGHSTFLLTLPSGQRVLTDPWLGNPHCPADAARPEALRPLDLILVSHGHEDHAADAAAVARATGAPVVCIFEVGQHLIELGVQPVRDMGIGGTQVVAGVTVTMTAALHSSSMRVNGETRQAGLAAGFVLRAAGMPTIYFAGDTALFGDIRLIGELHRPEIAFLPIGDHFTMGPDDAAVAARWLGVRQVVPMHWGTFPLLTGTPDALRRALQGTTIEVLDLQPGETAQ